MTESPLYPFGFGLSYAKLEWDNPKISNAAIKKEQSVDVTVDIKNTGSISTDEVVQLYISIDNKTEELPLASLINFKRVSIQNGASSKVSFAIPYADFSYINIKGDKVQHIGKASIIIANAAPLERSKELGATAIKFDVDVK